MAYTKTPLSLSNSHFTFVAVAIGSGDVLLLALRTTHSEDGGTLSFEGEELLRFKASDIKILNVFIANEVQTSS